MCQVCGSENVESHFGGFSCRACAAFFRRFFYSKKEAKRCTCKERKSNSYPCRKCRIEKCLRVGMTPEKLQTNRDKNKDESSLSLVPFEQPLSSHRIIFKETTNLSFSIPNWVEFGKTRDEKTMGRLFLMNIYELSCNTKIDIELVWNMTRNVFPHTRDLIEKDKYWIVLKTQIFIKMSKKNNDEYENMILSFYDGAFVEGKELAKQEILSALEPFWWIFFSKTAPAIMKLNLQPEELMAIIWLLFFDYGYTNISLECQEMCRNVRKLIYRELKNYQDGRKFDEMRFIETVEILEIIERGEKLSKTVI